MHSHRPHATVVETTTVDVTSLPYIELWQQGGRGTPPRGKISQALARTCCCLDAHRRNGMHMGARSSRFHRHFVLDTRRKRNSRYHGSMLQ